jgi:hypothetical protein
MTISERGSKRYLTPFYWRKITMTHTLVKVGGSLYDLPDLGSRLASFLARLECARITLYPGGGLTTDAIRAMDVLHHLGDESAHWLALRALTLNAFFLHALLPDFPVGVWPELPGKAILEPYSFALADENNTDHLPHTWDVTSDSLAARAAHLLGARELVLLKSSPLAEGMTWPAAAESGIVDAYFLHAVSQAPGLKVSVVNLRSDHLGQRPR